MKKIAILASMLLALPAAAQMIPALAQSGTSSSTPPVTGTMPKLTDAQLMTKIHKTNQEEIQAGKLAEQKCKTDFCKQYGEMLVRDHENADKELMQLAKSSGTKLDAASLPKVVQEREHTEHAKMDQLKKMSGQEFERTFGEVMQNGHANVIAMLTNAQGDVKDPQLKSFIDKTLPVLNTHETRAKTLASGKAESQTDQKAQNSTGSNTDRGTSGRTPSTSMHKSVDTSKDNSQSSSTPMNTSGANGSGTDQDSSQRSK